MTETSNTRRRFLKTFGAGIGVLSVVPQTSAAQSTTAVTAFDIDGSLTREPTRDKYWQHRDDGEIVGIVTARSDERANNFISNHDLNPDFLRTAKIKWPALNDIERSYGSDRTYTYVGSWLRDWLAANIADWQYVDGGEVQ